MNNMEKLKRFITQVALLLIALSAAWLLSLVPQPSQTTVVLLPVSQEVIIPQKGVEIPAHWGDLGARMTASGVIDRKKFDGLYAKRGGLSENEKLLAYGTGNGNLTITSENAPVILNLLWALGLANKNPILEDKTEMMNPAYGGTGNFASTGGWTIAKSGAMEHYDMHTLVPLTAEQQKLVDKVSRGIFRPCCGNSTHFPDCNHGMAMLGLLELLASQGVSEQDMYKTALAVNSYWFPDTYLTIATYMQNKGIEWNSIDSQQILGAEYFSAAGYAKVAAAVKTRQSGSGNQCGV